MSKAYIFLADGFEEIEALAPVDLLRRAGVNHPAKGGYRSPWGHRSSRHCNR